MILPPGLNGHFLSSIQEFIADGMQFLLDHPRDYGDISLPPDLSQPALGSHPSSGRQLSVDFESRD